MLKKLQYMVEGFRDETSHWQFLNVFFKPSVTRFFISWFALAPAVVKAIQELPSPLLIPISGTPVPIVLSLPFRWEVLWWASLAYAVSFLMHLMFCPGFIKRYPNYSAYTDRGHSPRWLVWEVFRAWRSIPSEAQNKLFKRLTDKKYAIQMNTQLVAFLEPTVSESGTEWAFDYKNESYVLQIDEELSELRQKDLFWEVMGRHGGSRVYMRYFIWSLLFIAALLVLGVVLQNIFFVLDYVVY